MGTLGYISIIIAFAAAIYSAISFSLVAKKPSAHLFQRAHNSLVFVAILVSVSVLVLSYGIFTHNFELEYVSSYTSLNTSPFFLLSALWAGNSGSLLFWAWLLSVFSLIVILTRRGKERELVPWAAVVLMVTEAFFLLLLVAVMNPFTQNLQIPADGSGLNPMLQNLGMVFHPPALLAGYVGFTVPFAFAVSALILGKKGNEWLLAMRKWILFSWLLLGIGNIIGMWWAYVELGWGGYWAWDPVENAGLMPWLIATAVLHSSIIQRRKGIFKVWTLLLMFLTFCLVIFGTFLTRSGMLSSVHTFNDTGMAPYFILFIALAFFGSLGLLFYRYNELKSSGSEQLVSKESTFFLNNLLLVGTTLVILTGTVFPAISEAVSGVKVSLNASFFNAVNGPLFLAIILLAGICTVIRWKNASLITLLKNILWPLMVSIVIAVILFATVIKAPGALLAFFICAFVFSSIISEFISEAKVRDRVLGYSNVKTWATLIWSNSQGYGGYIVHAGIVLIAVGVIGSSFYSVEKEETLKIGDSLSLNQYTLTYAGLDSQATPDKDIVIANLSMYKSGVLAGKIKTEKYFQKSQEQSVTEVGILSTLVEDLYVILQGWSASGATADFKVMINPLVSWIWIGGGVFLLGGLITFWPNRKNSEEGNVSKSEYQKLRKEKKESD